MKTLLQQIAHKIDARLNCLVSGNQAGIDKHEDALDELQAQLPSGSGIDSGTQIDLDRSTSNKIVLHTAYHHMDQGMYSGWTQHSIVITPHLVWGFEMRITGTDKNDIKDYLHQTFHHCLTQEVSAEVQETGRRISS